MLLGTLQVAGHEVHLADVLVRTAMARIEVDRALVMLEREVELLQLRYA
jgi:hypothetical protein